VQLGAYSTLKMASRFNPKKIKQEVKKEIDKFKEGIAFFMKKINK